jgi:enamine deaminase RidA (YjgF/YER057c/UK114 family)
MARQLIRSESPWEDKVGFSRALRVGNHVWIAGTAAIAEDGNAIAPYDAQGQTIAIFNKFSAALDEAGAELRHIVRTRIFITDMKHEAAVAKAHHDLFSEIRPVATMVEITGLVRPELLVEIEAEAFIDD